MIAVGNRIYVKATVTLTNDKGRKEITTAFAREEETKKGMDGSQITGASSSYAESTLLTVCFVLMMRKTAIQPILMRRKIHNSLQNTC